MVERWCYDVRESETNPGESGGCGDGEDGGKSFVNEHGSVGGGDVSRCWTKVSAGGRGRCVFCVVLRAQRAGWLSAKASRGWNERRTCTSHVRRVSSTDLECPRNCLLSQRENMCRMYAIRKEGDGMARERFCSRSKAAAMVKKGCFVWKTRLEGHTSRSNGKGYGASPHSAGLRNVPT